MYIYSIGCFIHDFILINIAYKYIKGKSSSNRIWSESNRIESSRHTHSKDYRKYSLSVSSHAFERLSIQNIAYRSRHTHSNRIWIGFKTPIEFRMGIAMMHFDFVTRIRKTFVTCISSMGVEWEEVWSGRSSAANINHDMQVLGIEIDLM